MSSKYHFSFEKLDFYHKALDYAEMVHEMVKNFPNHELYALSSQFRRASDSIALNIAEGYPGSDAHFIKHLNYSIYSANECVVCSTKALRRNYIDISFDEKNKELMSEITKMLSSLREYVRKRGERNEP